MSTKHTPGPWVARIDEIGIDVFQLKSGFGITQIGNYDELRKFDYNVEEAKANAKLIASAPKLLEAIKKIRNYFGENDKTVSEHKMFAIADEAIKEATE